MSSHVVRISACVVLLALAAVSGVVAQGVTSSGLIGRVTDEGGGALAGVTVEIQSTAMLGGSRAAVTDARGQYRFAELNPGLYTITVSLAGYRKTVQSEVKLFLGQTTSVPFKLEKYSGEETVTVTAEASAIDPTSSATATLLTNSYLQNMPTSRFQPDTLNLAPGINLDSAYGGGGSSANAWTIDGVDTSDPEAHSAWSFFNANVIEEVQLVGLGAPAEYGGFTGVVFNSNTKSGGNELSGLADVFYSNDSLVSSAGTIASADPTTPLNPSEKKFIDTTFQVGGPFIKDKLWYFVSLQYFNNVTNNGGPDRSEESPRAFFKINWQINGNNEITSWVEWDRYDITGRGGNAITPLEATVTEDAPEYVWNFAWKSVLSPNTIFNVALQGYTGYYYLDPQRGYNVAGHYDGSTGTYNTNSTFFFLADRERNQLNASLSHHASDFIKGDHDFKFGMEIERSTVRNRYGYPTGVWFYDNYYVAEDPGNGYIPAYYTLAYYGGSYDVHATNERISLYAQDSWKITPAFTFNPGVRIDLNRGSVPQTGEVFSTNPVAPRIGFAWDLTHNGKTILKAHYGRYYEGLFGAYYYWVDPGAFVPSYQNRIFPSGFTDQAFPPTGAIYAIDPDLKQPYLDQWILGLDRELWPGFTLSGTLVYRENKDFIESVFRKPDLTEPDYVPVVGFIPVEGYEKGTPGGGGTGTGEQVTLFDHNTSDTDVLFVTNPPGLKRTYKAFILTGTKRLTTNWQILASYVYSEARGNIDNVDFNFNSDSGGQNGGPSPFLDTPNSLVNADGKNTHDQTHQFKLQGSYKIPQIGLSISGNWTYYTGDTWTRTTTCLLTDEGDGDPTNGITDCHEFPQGVVRYFAEPRGSERLSSANEIDLRLEWQHAISGGQLGLLAEGFNLTNQTRATEVQNRDQEGFGLATEANLPRRFRVGARYSW